MAFIANILVRIVMTIVWSVVGILCFKFALSLAQKIEDLWHRSKTTRRDWLRKVKPVTS